MIFFFVPYLYFHHTRAKGALKQISFVAMYFLPIIFIALYAVPPQGATYVSTLWLLLFGFWNVYSAYEIGYIYNDLEKTKQEIFPTKRLSVEEVAFYERNKSAIYISRFLLVLINTVVAFEFSLPVSTVLAALTILVLFYIYNRCDGVINLPLHFFLVMARYVGPLMVFGMQWAFVFLPAIFFALPNMIERTREPKFTVINNKVFSWFNNAREGRYRYYAVIVVIHLLLLPFTHSAIFIFSLLLNVYFLLYRYASVKFLQRNDRVT
ncbi:hypothetical protein [Serratia rubidaea]|uniref:hypothetical protein n=1 Tax=Serratia rubidaea TaxID=61652 RepID=UPI000B307738|nr:hypothetical protein [Serratia rubidaea]WBF44019.1 hypothetical protein OLD77_15320 [Serratia rubidaea]